MHERDVSCVVLDTVEPTDFCSFEMNIFIQFMDDTSSARMPVTPAPAAPIHTTMLAGVVCSVFPILTGAPVRLGITEWTARQVADRKHLCVFQLNLPIPTNSCTIHDQLNTFVSRKASHENNIKPCDTHVDVPVISIKRTAKGRFLKADFYK